MRARDDTLFQNYIACRWRVPLRVISLATICSMELLPPDRTNERFRGFDRAAFVVVELRDHPWVHFTEYFLVGVWPAFSPVELTPDRDEPVRNFVLFVA